MYDFNVCIFKRYASLFPKKRILGLGINFPKADKEKDKEPLS